MSREALQAEVAVRQRRYLGASRSQRPPLAKKHDHTPIEPKHGTVVRRDGTCFPPGLKLRHQARSGGQDRKR